MSRKIDLLDVRLTIDAGHQATIQIPEDGVFDHLSSLAYLDKCLSEVRLVKAGVYRVKVEGYIRVIDPGK